MKVTFLGTGAGIPSKRRNVSSLALHLMNKRNSFWLFDCGEGTQHQLLHTSVKTRKIEKIFISHLHGDHIYGLPGLLASRSFQGAETPLTIYGPPKLEVFVRLALELSDTHLTYPLHMETLVEGKSVLLEEGWRYNASVLDHGIPSHGFRIQQPDSHGPLLMDKIRKENVEIGPMLRELKEGKDITVAHGKVVRSADVTGPPKRGKIVTILGDTRFSPQAVELARDADLLIHEATFAKEREVLAASYYHSTTVEAAETARLAGAKRLLMTHVSSRYQEEDDEFLLQEAREVFQNSELAADFMEISI